MKHKKEELSAATGTDAVDEALFAGLQKKRKRKKRKILITVAVILILVAVGLVLGTRYLRQKVTQQFAAEDTVTSAEVTTGSISTTVSGSGTLTNVDEESVTVPAGITVTEICVSKNDTISEGDVLAYVNLASVMDAMSQLQEELDALDEEIADAADDTVSSSVTTGVAGRVKLLYAEAGTNVGSCMYNNGALAVLSLDGYMAVDLSTDAPAAGDSVTVTLSDGTEFAGTVESSDRGTAVVLVSDATAPVDDTVTVTSEEGTELGTGTLYIHSPLRITGISGTVSAVKTAVNKSVSAGAVLYTLTDTTYSANYDALLSQRTELEEELLALMELYRNGALLAPFSGSVSSVDMSEDTTVSAETSVVTLNPAQSMSVTISVDESDILSLELGQSASVTISSISEDAFTGSLTEINKTATSSSGVTQYSAVITLDLVEGMLPGMSASVSIRINGVDDALLIPVEALHQTSSVSYVYTTYDEETLEYGGKVEVTTGLSNSTYVEITSGLEEGDTVWYDEGSDSLFDMAGMGGMGGMGDMGDMSEIISGDFGGGEMPSGGGGGGEMPSGGGNMPSGGFGGNGG